MEAHEEPAPHEFLVSEEMKAIQRKWREIYNKQLAQGGIIDLEKEKLKHRLPSPPPRCDVKSEVRHLLN